MNCWKACKEGFFLFWKHKGLWFRYYIINWVLALVSTFAVFQFMNREFGHSTALEGILKIYDFEIVTDILTNYGGGVAVLFHQSILWTVIFLLITAFLIGGIIKTYIENENENYWNNCATYFRKILCLAVCFFIIQIGVLFLFLTVFNSLIPGVSPDDIVSEVTALNQFKYLSFPYLVVVIFISTIHDYAKVFLQRGKPNTSSVFRSIGQSWIFCFKHIKNVIGLILINLIFFISFVVIYKIIETGFLQNSLSMIFTAFLLAQVSILLRIALKFWSLASITCLCRLSNISTFNN